MSDGSRLSDHWGKGDVHARVMAALENGPKPLDALTIEDLAPVDHYHARGFPATVELADRLSVAPGQHLLDIGSGLGGPARYFAHRFGCRVSGIDITEAFVALSERLTQLLRMQDAVGFRLGDGNRLPFGDRSFDGAYSLHVTMNVSDRAKFFSEAFRVLKPGAFFALTEHGLGPVGEPHYPLPWSEDGGGAYLMRPEDTHRHLEATGFADIEITYTGDKYLKGYRNALALAEQGALPALGTHLLLGDNALAKTRNAARNIEEQRTEPVQIICRRPA